MTHFHSYLKYPTPLSCWVLHYCCSYVFYFMFFTLLLNSNLYTALASYLTTVVISLTLCFYFTPSSTRIFIHALPLWLYLFVNFEFPPPPCSWGIHYHYSYSYYLPCLFINFTFPPPPGSWVIHYHRSYICYFMFLF